MQHDKNNAGIEKMFNLERQSPQKNQRYFPTYKLKSAMCNENRIIQIVCALIFSDNLEYNRRVQYRKTGGTTKGLHALLYM